MSKRYPNPEQADPRDVLRFHVTGAIERGEGAAIVEQSGRMAGIPSKAWREKAHIPTRSNADGRLTVCGLGMFDRPNIAETPSDVTCETCERVYGAWRGSKRLSAPTRDIGRI